MGKRLLGVACDVAGSQLCAIEAEEIDISRFAGVLVLLRRLAELVGGRFDVEDVVGNLKGKTDAVLNGLTGEQRFFVSFAQRWRNLQSSAALYRQIKTDTHAPGEYRSNTVRNLDAWYEAFKIVEGILRAGNSL